jgi:hypothetical protein
MVKRTSYVTVAVALAAAGAVEVSAQSGAREWASFSVEYGAFSPRTTFEDPAFGKSSFETAGAIGFAVAAWPHERLGLRLKAVRSDTNGTNETSEFAPIAVQDPRQYSFTGEVTARHAL